jgi:SUKH-4 immunity protein
VISHADLARLWGEANIVRSSVDAQAVTLPADAFAILKEVGLPRHVDPLFEVRDLAVIKIPGQSGLYWRFGSDFGTDLCVSADTGEVGSFSLTGEYPARFVNTSLALFIEFLVLVSAERNRFPDLGDDEIDQLIAALGERLQQLDERALAGPDNWWAVIFEQLREGLL